MVCRRRAAMEGTVCGSWPDNSKAALPIRFSARATAACAACAEAAACSG